ncbi:MAG: GTP cyclohydrolase II [Pseudomonadota bacterium]
MSYSLPSLALRARARGDLRMGVPVVIDSDAGAVLALAAETARADALDFARAHGPLSQALTRWRAQTLRIRVYDGDVARIALPQGVVARDILALADPALDLAYPLKGPFKGLRDDRAPTARAAIRLCKEAHILPSVVLAPLATEDAAKNLTRIPEADLRDTAPLDMQTVSAAPLPLDQVGPAHLSVFRPLDGSEEHYALILGKPDLAGAVPCRLHSACFTGDVLGSLKCDCGPQLRSALAQMHRLGGGILLYLNQEGRGIGLANKMRAYGLQDQGFDTVEANHRLGFEDEERDFRVGAAILRKLGAGSVRLLTNNPAKVARMGEMGINVVERLPLAVGHTHENAAYLATKAKKSGHLL